MNNHPLADYVRILARGKNASRNMTQDEAKFTLAQMLEGNYHPEQLGAIFMLLRVLEETPEEIAGFSAAANHYWPAGSDEFDLVWASYAGKRRQPFWWMLSALLLSQMGYRILVHGTLSHTPGRKYAHEVFKELGLPIVSEDNSAIKTESLVYLPCAQINERLQQWLSLKSILGVRSPINTVMKTISPNGVPSVQGVFHPNYRAIHTEAAKLNHELALVIKGEGGEFEVNPERKCIADFRFADSSGQIEIANTQSHFADKPENTDTSALISFWRGETGSLYGETAVLNTAALALCLIRQNDDFGQALDDCTKAWSGRDCTII